MPEGDEAVGDVAQEAARLVQAARRRVQHETTNAAGPRAEAVEGAGDHTTCQGCPWCRAKTAMGPVGAQTLDSLADLLAAASDSVRAFADSRRPHAEQVEHDTLADVPGDAGGGEQRS